MQGTDDDQGTDQTLDAQRLTLMSARPASALAFVGVIHLGVAGGAGGEHHWRRVRP